MAQDASKRTTVTAREEIAESLMAVAESPPYEGVGRPMVEGLDLDEKRAFLSQAFEQMAKHLASNHNQLHGESFSPGLASFDAVGELLDADNIDDIEVYKNGWHDPVVRVWLKDCPPWANTMVNVGFKFSMDGRHYNGSRAHAGLDVRQT